jgi:hypothetical protein
VHLISDLQKSGMPPGFTDLRLDEEHRSQLPHTVGKVQPTGLSRRARAAAYLRSEARPHQRDRMDSRRRATRTVTLLMNGKTFSPRA